MGAVVLDVTALPARVEEVARIRTPDDPGGFHNIFFYHLKLKEVHILFQSQYLKY